MDRMTEIKVRCVRNQYTSLKGLKTSFKVKDRENKDAKKRSGLIIDV